MKCYCFYFNHKATIAKIELERTRNFKLVFWWKLILRSVTRSQRLTIRFYKRTLVSIAVSWFFYTSTTLNSFTCPRPSSCSVSTWFTARAPFTPLAKDGFVFKKEKQQKDKIYFYSVEMLKVLTNKRRSFSRFFRL